MIQDAVESLINVFKQPKVFFADDEHRWTSLIGYNVFFAFIIAAFSSAFLNVYLNVFQRAGWRGLLTTSSDVVLQPFSAATSILAWSTLIYATLWLYGRSQGSYKPSVILGSSIVWGALVYAGSVFFGYTAFRQIFQILAASSLVFVAGVYAWLWIADDDDWSDILHVVSAAWLVSYPYVVLSTVLYFIQGLAFPNMATYSWSGLLLYGSSFLISLASVIHITTASVYGLEDRLDASWVEGVIATVIVPLGLFLVGLFTVYGITLLG